MQPTESTQQVQPVQTQPVARQMIAPTQAPESADTASTTSKSSWFPFRLRGGAGPCCEMLGCCTRMTLTPNLSSRSFAEESVTKLGRSDEREEESGPVCASREE
ncbi:hypothetical protein JCM24511_03002 [Saitozyma sp. JCM 24511]|nr:hypothetical protein JCM24511_03002 [Saitozyma sp. JCM 24511]